MPAMVSLIEAIDWFLGVGESLCFPWSMERCILVRLEKRTESIILGKIIAITATHRLIVLMISIVMILVSPVHYERLGTTVFTQSGVRPCTSLAT